MLRSHAGAAARLSFYKLLLKKFETKEMRVRKLLNAHEHVCPAALPSAGAAALRSEESGFAHTTRRKFYPSGMLLIRERGEQIRRAAYVVPPADKSATRKSTPTADL